jgi:phage FluMu protein Com
MSIEFRCVHCSKLLRTGDDTAGKQAKCPECGTVMTVPAAAEAGELSASAAGNDNSFGAAASYQAESGNPYQSPSPFSQVAPSGLPGTITPSKLDAGDVLARTWEIFKEQWGMCLVVCLIVIAIDVAFAFFLGIGAGIIDVMVRDQGFAVFMRVMVQVISRLFQIWLYIGQTKYFLKVARGQDAEITDLFSGGPLYPTVLAASILYGLMVFFGLLALIVPGIILVLMFSQYKYLIIDQNLGVIDSLSRSKELTDGNKGTLFLLALVAIGLEIAGMLALCVGVIPVIPFLSLMSAVTYLAMTGQPTADQLQERPMG